MTSELFGHEKGAFTGAVQRRLGRFEAANARLGIPRPTLESKIRTLEVDKPRFEPV